MAQTFSFKIKIDQNETPKHSGETYWNSRLQEEHQKMAKIIDEKSLCVDLCCGIGPFVIPIAKRGIAVLANDLNPNSIKFLQKNIKENLTPSRARLQKVKMGKIAPFGNVDVENKDGNFIIRQNLYELVKKGDWAQIECVMNLPGGAIFFLPAFKGFLQRKF